MEARSWGSMQELRDGELMKRPSIKALSNRCMGLWRQIVAYNKTTCEWCHMPSMVFQAHHVVTKGSSCALRFEPENGVYLCKGCHFKVHNFGYLDFSEWFLKNHAERWERLKLRKYNHFKMNKGNLELTEMKLKQELKDLGNG